MEVGASHLLRWTDYTFRELGQATLKGLSQPMELYEVALADSHRVSRARCYSGVSSEVTQFRVQDYYLLRWVFPDTFHYLITTLRQV